MVEVQSEEDTKDMFANNRVSEDPHCSNSVWLPIQQVSQPVLYSSWPYASK